MHPASVVADKTIFDAVSEGRAMLHEINELTLRAEGCSYLARMLLLRAAPLPGRLA